MRLVKYLVCWVFLLPGLFGLIAAEMHPPAIAILILLGWSVYRFVQNPRNTPKIQPGPSQQLLDVQSRLAQLTTSEFKSISHSPSNINLKRDEILFYSNMCVIAKAKAVSKYNAGTRGVSVTPIKGLSFRLGGVKGQMESHTQMVNVGEGILNITSSRIILSGIQSPIVLALDSLVTYDCSDTLVHLASDKASYVLTLQSEEGSIVEHIVRRLLSDARAVV